MARGCPGSCEGIAHGMAHSWHTGPITSQPKVAPTPIQIKHKQNKPATAATILRNLPTTPTSHAAGASAKAQHKQNLAMAAMIVCGVYPWHPQVACHHQPGPNMTNNTPSNGRNDCAEFTHDTHKSCVVHARPLAKHNTNKKLATAATIVRNLPTHPQSRAAPAQRKHNTNKSQQRLQRFCGIYPRTHKSCCNHRPNTTNKSRQRPQRLCRIYPCTHKSRCTST